MRSGLVAGGLAVTAMATLVAGRTVFVTFVALVAAVALVDLSAGLRAEGSAPVLPAAALPAVVLPISAGLHPGRGWELFPRAMAACLLVAVVLLLLFGRRRDTTRTWGATVLVGAFVGLGATCLVLLYDLPEGFRWVLTLLVVVTVAGLAPAALGRVLGGSRAGAMVAGVTGATVAVVLTMAPPLDWMAGPALGALVLLAAVGADELEQLMGGRRFGGVADTLLLAAPAAYLVGRYTAL